MTRIHREIPAGSWEAWAWATAMASSTLIVGVVLVATVSTSDPSARIGTDFNLYVTAARSWLAGDGFYNPWQLTGTYGMDPPPILYPPPILALLVPFTILPAFLWWAIPLAIVAWAVRRHRPARWSWPLLILLFGWATGVWLVWSGNPMIWAAAALAYATVRGWSAPLVLLKPTLAPFSVFGIRTRGWWLTMAVLAPISLAFLPMWPSYLTALGNFNSGRGFGYSLPDYALMMGIVVAWAAATRARIPTTSVATSVTAKQSG